jgi:hypothetical protein
MVCDKSVPSRQQNRPNASRFFTHTDRSHSDEASSSLLLQGPNLVLSSN